MISDKKLSSLFLTGCIFSGMLYLQQAQAAVALDRTRVIFNGSEKSVSLSISNENKELPYLAQGWIENEQGQKVKTPLAVLPPIQRLEAGAKSQMKISALPDVHSLAKDRETLFYFNLREIPPKSEKANVLQLALQTRIKLFYRPDALAVTNNTKPWQEELTLTKQGNQYQVNNPTPYYVTLVSAAKKVNGSSIQAFEPLMIDPNSSAMINISASVLGDSPVLTYVNDYGGRPQLSFSCQQMSCQAKPVK